MFSERVLWGSTNEGRRGLPTVVSCSNSDVLWLLVLGAGGSYGYLPELLREVRYTGLGDRDGGSLYGSSCGGCSIRIDDGDFGLQDAGQSCHLTKRAEHGLEGEWSVSHILDGCRCNAREKSRLPYVGGQSSSSESALAPSPYALVVPLV